MSTLDKCEAICCEKTIDWLVSDGESRMLVCSEHLPGTVVGFMAVPRVCHTRIEWMPLVRSQFDGRTVNA